MDYGSAVEWLVRQPVPCFYLAFLVYGSISLVAGRAFEFMETAATALSASALPIGLALALCALETAHLGKVTAVGGFDLYLALLALTMCYVAGRAIFPKS